MQIRPFEELEAAARERYRAKYARVPAPKVINIPAVLILTAPREFQWGGVGYRAPPLGYLAGAQLQTAANALREALAEGTDPALRSVVVRTTAAAIATVVQPRRPRWTNRIYFRRALQVAPPVEVEALARWLLSVPDASPTIPPEKAVTIDVMDNLAWFVQGFPAWVDPVTGYPRSWAHYQHGLRYLMRAAVREDLRHGVAVRFAGAVAPAWKTWSEDQAARAGWS